MSSFPVYSVRFLANQLVNSDAAFLVPGGYRAVVRSVAITQTSPGGFICEVGIGGAANFFAVSLGLTSDVTMASYECRHVVEAGEQIVAHGVGTGDVVVSGYLLTLP